jgi:hypothetical protein
VSFDPEDLRIEGNPVLRGTKRPPMRVSLTTKTKFTIYGELRTIYGELRTTTLMVKAIAPVLLRRRFFFLCVVTLGRIRII